MLHTVLMSSSFVFFMSHSLASRKKKQKTQTVRSPDAERHENCIFVGLFCHRTGVMAFLQEVSEEMRLEKAD